MSWPHPRAALSMHCFWRRWASHSCSPSDACRLWMESLMPSDWSSSSGGCHNGWQRGSSVTTRNAGSSHRAGGGPLGSCSDNRRTTSLPMFSPFLFPFVCPFCLNTSYVAPWKCGPIPPQPARQIHGVTSPPLSLCLCVSLPQVEPLGQRTSLGLCAGAAG